MSIRWPRKMFGIEIIYIRDGIARKVTSLVAGGRGVWALLPDGRVGTNNEDFFKRSYAEDSQEGVRVAERLWRLGRIRKADYLKLATAREQKDKRREIKARAADFAWHAKLAGIPLSANQRITLKNLGVELH